MARVEKKIEIRQGAPEYMSTYGDLVTLLLCFFVLLYAMSIVDMTKFQQMAAAFSGNPISLIDASGGAATVLDMNGSGIMEMPSLKQVENADQTEQTNETEQQKGDEKEKQEVQAELKRMASDFKTYFAEYNMQDKIDVDVGDYSLEFTLTEGISFDTGKADLKPEIISILDMLGEELEKYPGTEISIEGHTDNMPINTPQYPSNWYLSAARAISVGMYLVEQKGIDPSRVDARGRGEYKPIASNDTEEGRAKNRRVEIRVYSSLYSDVD